MERKQIYLSSNQIDELNRLAEERGVSVSLVIREAVAQYIADPEAPVRMEPEEDPLWSIVGIADSYVAPRDGSVNHDAVLYGKPKRRTRAGRSG